MKQQDLMLYVHVPFCSSKCHFCSYVSPIPVADLVKSKDRFPAYTAAVLTEIRRTGERLRTHGIRPKLIYFGGGTPSLLPPADLVSILKELHAEFPGAGTEVDTTIEISPDTLTNDCAQILRQGGFNRVSFGVQSFDADRARLLGRAHTPAQAIKGFEQARKAGFTNINLDLMIGLPGETDEEFRKNIETALQLDPDHISIYPYKKFKGTVFARQIDSGKLREHPVDVVAQRYEQACEMLAAAGFDEYMFQLFTRNGKLCLVDFHYFSLDTDYLGFGQGAQTLVGGRLYYHSQPLESYLRRPAHSHFVSVAERDEILKTKLYEMMHFEEGLHPGRFTERLGITVEDAAKRHPQFHRALASALETGFVQETATNYQFTSREARLRWLVRPPYWDTTYQVNESGAGQFPILA